MLDQLQLYIPHLVIFSIIFILMYKAHKSADSVFNVFDYIIDPATKKASITRTGQVIAILTSTWAIAKMSALGTLTAEILAIYLAALGASSAWSKYVGAKFTKETKSE